MQRVAALLFTFGIAGALACSDSSSSASPTLRDSTSTGSTNLVHRCTTTPTAVRIPHSFYTDSAGAFIRDTVYVGDTARTYAPSFGYFIGVLFGSPALVNQYVQYVAPTNCVGIDSAWYTGTPWLSPRKLDTLLYVFTVLNPGFSRPIRRRSLRGARQTSTHFCRCPARIGPIRTSLGSSESRTGPSARRATACLPTRHRPVSSASIP